MADHSLAKPNPLIAAILRGPGADTQSTGTSADPSQRRLASAIPALAAFIKRFRVQQLRGLQDTLHAVIHGAEWEVRLLEEGAGKYPHKAKRLAAKAKKLLGRVAMARKGARHWRAFYLSPTFDLYATLVWLDRTATSVLEGLRGENEGLRKDLEEKLHMADFAAEKAVRRVTAEFGLNDGGQWSTPQSPEEWSKVFKCDPRTFVRLCKKGKIRAKILSTKSYMVHLKDLPTLERGAG